MDTVSPQSPQDRPRGLRRGLSAVRLADGKGSVHTYNEEEKEGLVEIVNDLLKDDLYLRDTIPINPASQDIFDSVHDGVLLCKLVNTIRPGTIEPNKINEKQDLGLFEKLENLAVAVNGAQTALNMPLVNIGVNDILEGRPVLVLAILWQLINLHLHTQVARTAQVVHLDYLLKDEVDKSIDDEQIRILLRWFNHHLSNAKHTRRVNNLGSDIRDSENYIILLHELAPKECSLSALSEPDTFKRAEAFLAQAARIGCKKFLGPLDIVQGNARLNFAFLANLFTKYQRPPSPEPEPIKIELPSKIEPAKPRTEIERKIIAEERRKFQQEIKAKEILQLQKAIVIAKELMNLPSAEVLQEELVKEEREIIKIQLKNEKLELKVASLHHKVDESHRETRKVEADFNEVAIEIKTMETTHHKEVTQIKSRLDDGVAKVAALRERIADAVAQSTQLVAQNHKLAEEKEVLEEKIVKEQKDTTRLTRVREKLEKEMTNTRKNLSKVQNAKIEVARAATKIERQIQDINSEIVDINKAILQVDHFTELTKEDIEQETERTGEVKVEKSRLIERRATLEKEMDELQDRLQKEEELTVQEVEGEKRRQREELLDLTLTHDREMHDYKNQKDTHFAANIDMLARKDAAHLRKTIVKSQKEGAKEELRSVTREKNNLNAQTLETEMENTKLERAVARTNDWHDESATHAAQEDEEIEELLRSEREARRLLEYRKEEQEALEERTKKIKKEMQRTLDRTEAAESEVTATKREIRSLQIEIEADSTVPDEIRRQRERLEALKEYDKEKEEGRMKYRHDEAVNRLNKVYESREKERDNAMELLAKEKERVSMLKKEKAELEDDRSITNRAERDEDLDDLLAEANAILQN